MARRRSYRAKPAHGRAADLRASKCAVRQGTRGLPAGAGLFCVEGIDQPCRSTGSRSVPTSRFKRGSILTLGGTVVLSAKAKAESSAGWDGVLYRQQPPERDAAPFTAVPYFAWDNREPGEMQVWMREFEVGRNQPCVADGHN